MKSQFVKDLREYDRVDDIFRVVEMQVRPSKGEPYLSLRVMDLTGDIGGKIWKCGNDPVIAAVGDFVRIRGTVEDYQGTLQIKDPVWQWSTESELAAIDYADFEPVAPLPYDSLVKRFKALVDDIRVINPALSQVVTLATRLIWNDFAKFPAAILVHHATKHGLLQHSVEVAHIARSMGWEQKSFGRSSDLSVDLVVAGGLLHDVGKVFEFARNEQGAYDFTEAGGLYGHVYLGMRHVETACTSTHLDALTTVRLLHIIASHHGKLEHGAIVEPRTDEAKIVAAADKRSAELDIDHGVRENARFDMFPRTINGRIYAPKDAPPPLPDPSEHDPQEAFDARKAGTEYKAA